MRQKEKLFQNGLCDQPSEGSEYLRTQQLFFPFTRLTMAVHGGLRPEGTPAASRAMVRFSPEVGIDMIL